MTVRTGSALAASGIMGMGVPSSAFVSHDFVIGWCFGVVSSVVCFLAFLVMAGLSGEY